MTSRPPTPSCASRIRSAPGTRGPPRGGGPRRPARPTRRTTPDPARGKFTLSDHESTLSDHGF
eukprot:6492892-Pyramimonas_sp.AAC.1